MLDVEYIKCLIDDIDHQFDMAKVLSVLDRFQHQRVSIDTYF